MNCRDCNTKYDGRGKAKWGGLCESCYLIDKLEAEPSIVGLEIDTLIPDYAPVAGTMSEEAVEEEECKEEQKVLYPVAGEQYPTRATFRKFRFWRKKQ